MSTQNINDIITKEKCLSNWNIPLFINYPYKEIISFIRKEFSTKDNDLLLLIRLYQEICILQKDDPKKGFNLFLSDETGEKITSEEILYLIQNIKRLLYYNFEEIKQKNNSIDDKNIYNSIINENPLLVFVKENFYIFISIFKSGGFNEKNKTKDEKELDSKFKVAFGFDNDISKFLDDKKDNKMDIEDEDEIIDANKNNNNDDNIKIEILNIYNFILNAYTDLDRPDEDIINFSQIIIKYLVSYLSKNKNGEILNKLKKSLSLLLGLYIKCFKEEEEKSIFHPIRVIFKQSLNYLLKSILFNELKENNKSEIENDYNIILSIYNLLLNQNNKNLLIDLQNIILYHSKQLIYENIDSSKMRNPLEFKSINGLNDIDKKIIYHPYLFNILSLLDAENANSFLGFFIKYFYVSEKNKLLCCKENIIKCLEYFIKIKWLSDEYTTFIKIINDKNTEFEKIKKINEYIYLYLRTHRLNQDNNHLKENGNNKKAIEKLQYLYKSIILENINVLN